MSIPFGQSKTSGALAGTGAYLVWGVIALYFNMLDKRGVAPLSLLAHRVVWSMLFCMALLVALRRLPEAKGVLRDRKRLGALGVSSLLIAINWLAFMYAVNRGHVAEAALGYFITPLVSVLLGLFVLKERLRPWQWISVALAAVGVGKIVIAAGIVPWIGIAVALSFAFYGLVRKMTAVTPVVGLTIETLVLLPLAMIYIGMTLPQAAFGGSTYLLLAFSGITTAIPLVLFAHAARTLQLSTLGFLQYIAPTCQFFVALFVLHERINAAKLAGFIVIWVSLLIFSVESAWRSRQARLARPST